MDNHPAKISQEIFQPSIIEISLEITNIELYSYRINNCIANNNKRNDQRVWTCMFAKDGIS